MNDYSLRYEEFFRLPGQLSRVAEIEAATRYTAEHPAPPPAPPDNPRDFLHLAAIEVR